MSSKSSGRLNHNLSSHKQQISEKYGSRMDYKFNSNTSKERDHTKLKENEFRKLLRPVQSIRTTGHPKNKTSSKVDLSRFTITTLVDEQTPDNSLFQTSDVNGNGKPKAKSDQKVYSAKSRTSLIDEAHPNASILREK